MASDDPAEASPRRWRAPALAGRSMLLWVWLPVLAVGVLHYATSPMHPWAHDILRRLYYLPIVVAALRLGLGGGLAAAAVVSVTYLPHAFVHPSMFDPGRGLEKLLEVLLYFAVGGIAGYLAGQERRRRQELQRALEERERLTRELVRAGRLGALGEAVAGIAHEIRNPLHALAGTAEVVDAVVPREAAERRLWELHVSEIARMQRIADRFLSFASPAPPRVARLDLRQVGGRLHELVVAQARQARVELELELPDREVEVEGDRDQLAQVGMNVVQNALAAISERPEGERAEPGRGRIRVSVEAGQGPEAGHRLVVENDGPPISAEALEHVFDPFWSGEARGTGLGLSIAARIAEGHGGRLEARNGGLGVVFTLLLPRAGDSPPRV